MKNSVIFEEPFLMGLFDDNGGNTWIHMDVVRDWLENVGGS